MRANSRAENPSVAVLLSGREQFSPYFGGAIARWTYEVYSRISDQVAVTVLGFPTGKKNLYPLPHESSRVSSACSLLARVPFARRFEENVWLRAFSGRLRKFNAVHIHNRPQWVAALRRSGYEGAIILHLHNDHLGHWSAFQLDALAPELDAIAVCSAYLGSTFAPRSALLNAKTHVVPNGANLQLFFPREELREPKTIFFAGRFDPEKGVLQLLKAYERTLEAHPDAKLVVAGGTGFGAHHETPYVREVRQLARRLTEQRCGQIRFAGYVDHDKELPQYFQKATVSVTPSLFQEPFGLVNAEAMACATTVVGSKRGGIPEVIGDAGLLIDPENTEEFAAAISGLLVNPQYCRQLGQAGYARCRRMFDWSTTAETWKALLGALLL